MRSWSARVSLVVAILMVLLALLGPLLSPHSPTALIGRPFGQPSAGHPLGLDVLGRDVLSRILHGGRSVVFLGGLAVALAYLCGGFIGLVAGFSRSAVDPILMRTIDVVLAFPSILLLLLLVAGLGISTTTTIIGIVIVLTPSITRIIRTATREVSAQGYVEAAIARGDPTMRILFREIVPNILPTIVADAGPRFTSSILLVAALNFLGLGLRPPSSDWALMIAENRIGLSVNSWPVLMPAALIAVLTVSVNLAAESMLRSRTVGPEGDTVRP